MIKFAFIMKKVKKEPLNIVEEPQTTYLTTRALVRALSKATRNLTKEALDLRGSVVIKDGDWIVRKFSNGNIEKLEKIKKVKLSKNIDLR